MKGLIDYFKRNLKKGYTPSTLKVALISQDYSKVAVEEAFRRATMELAEKAPVLKEKPVIKYEIINEDDKAITIKKSWFRRIFG